MHCKAILIPFLKSLQHFNPFILIIASITSSYYFEGNFYI